MLFSWDSCKWDMEKKWFTDCVEKSLRELKKTLHDVDDTFSFKYVRFQYTKTSLNLTCFMIWKITLSLPSNTVKQTEINKFIKDFFKIDLNES